MEMETMKKHIAHEHSLILNENYTAKEGDVCCVCKGKIISCTWFVYSCSLITTNDFVADKRCFTFLLHKNCAELPLTIQNPTNPKHFLKLSSNREFYPTQSFILSQGYITHDCKSCLMPMEFQVKEYFFYSCETYDIFVCVRCATKQVESLESPQYYHPAHTQHPLALVHRPSSFKCDACNVEDDDSKDYSYRCTKCQFWMHKTCADSPTSFHFHCHDKHPLLLAFSLPLKYLTFSQHCKLCNITMSRLCWLYYCPKCRFFAHFHCARSSQISFRSSAADEISDSSLVQLPPADESLVDVLFLQFLKAMSTLNQNHDTDTTISINHWAHQKHPLQLITINELKDDEMLLQCDGCAKPIRSTNRGDQFYGCVPCNFFMHRVCGEFPRKFKHHLFKDSLDAGKSSEPYKLFECNGCSLSCNGIFFDAEYYKLHIGCLALPKIIKHEAHHHPLNNVKVFMLKKKRERCSGCAATMVLKMFMGVGYMCGQYCQIYICYRCIMKPTRVKHMWDPHPLSLIYDPSMVSDHEHEFECEYCSREINTNFWFYHCAHCDISFHLNCFERSNFSEYSNVKFGATDIIIDDNLHPHSLTFVLNKKFATCENCSQSQLGEPVFKCVPCKAIFCVNCCHPPTQSSSLKLK